MLSAVLGKLRQFQTSGILVSPKAEGRRDFGSRIETFHPSHPIPDAQGLRACRRVLDRVSRLRKDGLMLCLISGGASALLPCPVEGINIQDKIAMTRLLVQSDATIHEINSVRRHLSRLKGGRLIEICPASTVISLIMSDVPGNDLADIGSGLTAADPTHYDDALKVLKTHGLWERTPSRIRELLTKGTHGSICETPKPGDLTFRKVHNFIIADNGTACKAAERTLRKAGVTANTLTTSAELRARDMGKLMGAIALEANRRADKASHPSAIILGGESTVRVTGKGLGGRNQEVGLSGVQTIDGLNGTVMSALGTDGIDGNSPAAGAITDGNTYLRAKRRKLNPDSFLSRNDSYNFFRLLNDSLVTGPTGTNVGDIYLVISNPR